MECRYRRETLDGCVSSYTTTTLILSSISILICAANLAFFSAKCYMRKRQLKRDREWSSNVLGGETYPAIKRFEIELESDEDEEEEEEEYDDEDKEKDD